MPTNDNSVLGIPSIQCPSCRYQLEVPDRIIGKFSKRQRRDMERAQTNMSNATQSWTPGCTEDFPSTAPERSFVTVTCSNDRCDQYNKFKVLELPRIETPVAKVEL